jgi:hypothetical protein
MIFTDDSHLRPTGVTGRKSLRRFPMTAQQSRSRRELNECTFTNPVLQFLWESVDRCMDLTGPRNASAFSRHSAKNRPPPLPVTDQTDPLLSGFGAIEVIDHTDYFDYR